MSKQAGSGEQAYAVVSSKRVYKGRIVTVRLDRIRMPDGNIAPREVAETTDAVAVAAIDEHEQVCLIRHYRHPQRGFVWELPAGRLDVANETPLKAAKRELREEVRLASRSWTLLARSISSPGFATERIHVFLAAGAYATRAAKGFKAEDEERGIVIEMRPLSQAIADITSGKIQDGKTIVGLLLAAKHLQK
jgi:8-oxo-dGTP pyrophosphatase MutT (NUDIX family)